MQVSFLIEAMVKPSRLQAFAHRPALVRSKCGFENRIKNTFFIRSVSAYRELLIAAVLVVTIVQHRTSVLDKTACVCSKTSRVEHTKSVHNRTNPAVFGDSLVFIFPLAPILTFTSAVGKLNVRLLWHHHMLLQVISQIYCQVFVKSYNFVFEKIDKEGSPREK